MQRNIKNLISVGLSAIRFCFLKILCGGRLTVSLIERFSPNSVFEMSRNARVVLGKRIRVHSESKIKVRDKAQLSIGNDVAFNYGYVIVCRECISIGSGTEFGPSVYVYDHDHDYHAGLKSGRYKTAPVQIGKNCWIGANTVILRGTKLGDNCIVGAGSVIKGQYPDNSVIIQKRAEVVSTYRLE